MNLDLPRSQEASDLLSGGTPLVVDLDGTLISNDLFFESLLSLLKDNPEFGIAVFRWLLVGRARLKTEIAARVEIDAKTLPIDRRVLEFIRAEKAKGRRIYLASGSARRYVKQVAEELGIFDGYFSTDNDINLTGANKARALVEAFGKGGFDYIGNSSRDIPVWQSSRLGYVVASGLPLPASNPGRKEANVEVLTKRSIRPIDLVKLLRPHQWSKNLLIFVPAALNCAGHDYQTFLRLAVFFVAFGLVASATYVVNDIFDASHDRRHWRKKCRPIASGDVPIQTAIGLSAICGSVGLAISASLGAAAVIGVVGYVALTLLYSFRFKRVSVVDVSLLAGLYTLRLLLGIVVARVALSPWLLVFSFSFFLSLALAKRHTEITAKIRRGDKELGGRSYRDVDAPFVMGMGIAAGMSSILVFALYLLQEAFIIACFRQPYVLWFCPLVLLLWFSRLWLLCGRGELHDDPVIFAMRDRKSLILVGIIGLVLLTAFVSPWSLMPDVNLRSP